jgi:hypothetical protein
MSTLTKIINFPRGLVSWVLYHVVARLVSYLTIAGVVLTASVLGLALWLSPDPYSLLGEGLPEDQDDV